MNVVFVNRFCHPDHSATSQILSDLAQGLASRGMKVTLVASRQRYDDAQANLPSREAWRDVEIRRVWTTRFGRSSLPGRALDYLSFYVFLPWTLAGLLRRGDVVVAKTDPPLVALVVALVAKLRGARMVNWLQDVFPEVAINLGEPRIPGLLGWWLKRMRDRSLRQSAMNVAIGGRMAEYFVGRGIDAARVQVIANWAHEDIIKPQAPGTSRLRRSLGLDGRFVVGYSGNLGRAHDTGTIFDAAKLLSGRPDIAFLIIGGGHGYDSLRKRAVGSGLPNVYFLPYQSREALSDSMGTPDLHLVSLRPALEGQIVPSKLYGIAAAARAIGFIGDPDGELARLVAGAQCGFSVRVGEGNVLAQAISELAGNRQRCHEQGAMARRLVEGRASRDGAHEQWHELLLRVGG